MKCQQIFPHGGTWKVFSWLETKKMKRMPVNRWRESIRKQHWIWLFIFDSMNCWLLFDCLPREFVLFVRSWLGPITSKSVTTPPPPAHLTQYPRFVTQQFAKLRFNNRNDGNLNKISRAFLRRRTLKAQSTQQPLIASFAFHFFVHILTRRSFHTIQHTLTKIAFFTSNLSKFKFFGSFFPWNGRIWRMEHGI